LANLGASAEQTEQSASERGKQMKDLSDKHEAANKKIQQLEKRSQEAESRNEHLEKGIESVTNKLKTEQLKTEGLERELAGSRAKVDKTESLLHIGEKKIKDLETEVRSLRDQLSSRVSH